MRDPKRLQHKNLIEPISKLAQERMKNSKITIAHYDNNDVTRTELSADPVKKMGKVGCQSTAVTGAL
jgi:hypothetical protein